MASAIAWRSLRSATGSPDERSVSTVGPNIVFNSGTLLVLQPRHQGLCGLVRGAEDCPVGCRRRGARRQYEQQQAQARGHDAGNQDVSCRVLPATSTRRRHHRSPARRPAPRLVYRRRPPPLRLELPLALCALALLPLDSRTRLRPDALADGLTVRLIPLRRGLAAGLAGLCGLLAGPARLTVRLVRLGRGLPRRLVLLGGSAARGLTLVLVVLGRRLPLRLVALAVVLGVSFRSS